MLNLIHRSFNHPLKTAIIDQNKRYTYENLYKDSDKIATLILTRIKPGKGPRVCYMVKPGYNYVRIQWAVWKAGAVAVPLSLSYPMPQLKFIIQDTSASLVICSENYLLQLEPLCNDLDIPLINFSESEMNNNTADLPDVNQEKPALILYTSGTTGKPKGVVLTHQNIESQIVSLTQAWKWNSKDHILSILPLHHIHGIVNVVCCALWSTATCEFLPEFSSKLVFDKFLEGNINLFMAVPTIYFKLIAHYEQLSMEEKTLFTKCLQKFRLMVSGSAALPVTVLEKWKVISGHTLLERYGMTEIGMALSNSYEGERKPGFVGKPLPGVEVRLCDEQNNLVFDEPGEIQVKGKNVFREYWQREDSTLESFTTDGWFKTGDVAIQEGEYYKILGRISVDIIKTGGYKVSALEIEEVMRTHPCIKDCGVVGIEDEEWGERLAGAIVPNGRIDVEELAAWLKVRLPGYKVPRLYKFVDDLPRNAMGKITKKEIKLLFN